MAFKQAPILAVLPYPVRHVVHWFMPSVRQLRALITEAHDLVDPVVAQRNKLRAEAAAKGKSLPSFNDCIDWAEAESKGQHYDPAVFQLNISVAAIHTTTDLATQTILNLAERPELVTELREEVTRVLRAEGWKKSALFNMKLLDSTIKETQRLKPSGTRK